ncbi:MAG: TGS domain-containing protein, partial [Clostridia bacterium]|nr:TGS domain-containing protein [Clostridia bacterium]
MNITLKDGNNMVVDGAKTAYEITKQISERLAKAALVCKVDGVLTSMNETIDHDCNFEVLTWNDDEGKTAYRHTASHILAQA